MYIYMYFGLLMWVVFLLFRTGRKIAKCIALQRVKKTWGRLFLYVENRVPFFQMEKNQSSLCGCVCVWGNSL